MTILCAGHADDLQAGSDYQDAPCRPSMIWRGGHGRAVMCDVIANPSAIAAYLTQLPSCAFCPAGNHYLCERRRPVTDGERPLVVAVFGDGATGCCCAAGTTGAKRADAGASSATRASVGQAFGSSSETQP